MTPYDAAEIADQSLAEDGDDPSERAYVCAYCGTSVDPHEWHPVATHQDGFPGVYLFCQCACRTAWLDEEATR
jgi:hypothetical protein